MQNGFPFEQVTFLKYQIYLGVTEIVESETSDEKEIHFKSSSGSLNRMSFASSPCVVAVNNLYLYTEIMPSIYIAEV